MTVIYGTDLQAGHSIHAHPGPLKSWILMLKPLLNTSIVVNFEVWHSELNLIIILVIFICSFYCILNSVVFISSVDISSLLTSRFSIFLRYLLCLFFIGWLGNVRVTACNGSVNCILDDLISFPVSGPIINLTIVPLINTPIFQADNRKSPASNEQ